MVVATARQRPEAFEASVLTLGEYPDGQEILCPIRTVRGRADGPALWVQACIHGPEVGGIAGIHDVLRKIDPFALRGRIVFALLGNPLGYRDNARLNAVDGKNFNRVFPGDMTGTPTERMAASLMAAAQMSDAAIDLHSGGNVIESAQYAIYSSDGTDVGTRSRQLAMAAGFDTVWRAPRATLQGAAYLAFLDIGIPAVLVESGGGGRVSCEDVRRFSGAIFGVCRELGMLDGTCPPQAREIEGAPDVLRASHGGLFRPYVAAGDDVALAQVLGEILALDGSVKECLLAQRSGFVASIAKNYHQIYAGEEIATII